MHQFVIQLKKIILISFLPKKNFFFFPKEIISANFKPLCYCKFMQKIRKIPIINFFKFRVNFGTILAQKLQNKIFPKTFMTSIVCLFANVILEKIRRILSIHFSWTLENLIPEPFWGLFAEHFFFFLTRSLFKLNDTLTSCKKWENCCMSHALEKNSAANRQTEKLTEDISQDSISQVKKGFF